MSIFINWDINKEISDISAQEKLMNFGYKMNLNIICYNLKYKTEGDHSIWKRGHPKSSIFTLEISTLVGFRVVLNVMRKIYWSNSP